VAVKDRAVAALRSGKPVVLPTDTVYGLAATPFDADAVARLSALKRRPPAQPIALLARDVETVVELVPELGEDAAAVARALLPGPLTLVLPNPAMRFAWLGGERADTIGVRVPSLPGVAADVLREVGALAATSANLTGGADPARLEDVPPEIRGAVAVAVDGGALPGRASTVVDLTGAEPRVLREGAVPAAVALERAAAALAAYS
jgi:tRNA threonylcarbamoyl adenosine modification protein (Sua5/YciO/YrdC/YwlC family)